MIFSKLFTRPKIITHPELGELMFVNDGVETYWKVMKYTDYSLMAISGTESNPNRNAVSAFIELISNNDKLFTQLNKQFIDLVKPEHEINALTDVRKLFRLYSLTVNDTMNYEFGVHSNSSDVFVEIFVRKGVVTEMYKDIGCCE